MAGALAAELAERVAGRTGEKVHVRRGEDFFKRQMSGILLALLAAQLQQIAVEGTHNLLMMGDVLDGFRESADRVGHQIRVVQIEIDDGLLLGRIAQRAQLRVLALRLRGNRRAGEIRGFVMPSRLQPLVRAIPVFQPRAETRGVGGREVHPLVLIAAPHHPLLRRAGRDVVADHAVGIGRRLDVRDEPAQPLDRVAPPGLRGPARRRLAPRVDERHEFAVTRIHQHDVIGMRLAPPLRGVQVQAREEVGVGILFQQHQRPLIELREVVLPGRGPRGARKPVARLGRRCGERVQRDPCLREVAKDFRLGSVSCPGHAVVRLAIDEQRRRPVVHFNGGDALLGVPLLDGHGGHLLVSQAPVQPDMRVAQAQRDGLLSAESKQRHAHLCLHAHLMPRSEFRQRRRQIERRAEQFSLSAAE